MESKQELCIPRIGVEIRKEYIFKIISKLRWGYNIRIHELLSRNNDEYKRVIIKLQWNMNDEKVKKIHHRLMVENNPMYIVYNMPFYWKVVKNKSNKEMKPPPPAYKKPILETNDSREEKEAHEEIPKEIEKEE
jgi:hypothetical protein